MHQNQIHTVGYWLQCFHASNSPVCLSRRVFKGDDSYFKTYTWPNSPIKEAGSRLGGQRKAEVSPGPVGDLTILDDRSLATELASGRHEALSVFFGRYRGPVFRAARRILGDSGEAEEVALEVFLEMYRHISEFDPVKGPFISWLLRRAKFRALDRKDQLKRERFYDRAEFDEIVEAEVESRRIRMAYRQEIEPLLEEQLSRLEYRKRRVVNLTFFEGHTAKEIAQITGESVHVVRHLLTEALKELRSAAQKRIWKKQGKGIE